MCTNSEQYNNYPKEIVLENTGNHLLPASREQIWKYLIDPKVLHTSISGCEIFEQINQAEFAKGKTNITLKSPDQGAELTF